MGVRVELAAGSVEIQRMADYLLVVERGVLAGPECAVAYRRAMERERDAHGVRHCVIDQRGDGDGGAEGRALLWQWLDPDAFDRVALVASGDMRATELNMEALARRMPVRAFTTLVEAKEWALRPHQARRTSVPPAPPSVETAPYAALELD
ncbi:MAG: hypothetical protein CMN30_34290 [Sandaracinus sp.]|nr:hypothetical protein [Sandaracinus sp.]|tara:strand:- start:71 stop:523 length:453 start_codon:yes stop_codon:yes gene_type:complete